MEKYLTSIEDKERHRATLLLGDLFQFLQNKVSYPAAVLHLFVIFFCHRLADYPSVIPSLHALQAIVKFHGEIFEVKYFDVIEIFRNIFNYIHVQSFAQNIRQKVLELMHAILSSSKLRSSAKSIGLFPSMIIFYYFIIFLTFYLTALITVVTYSL